MPVAVAESQPLSLHRQLRLLRNCAEEQSDLHAELEALGLSYDSLRYRRNPSYDLSLTEPLSLEKLRLSSNGIPFVSFFSGAGGMDLGFEAAGFSHVAAVDTNPLFCETLRHNRPKWSVLGPPDHTGDVSNFEELSSLLRKEVGLHSPFDGIFIGGPPCQPFSIAANQRFAKSGPDFKRVGFQHTEHGSLLFDFIRLIIEFKPSAFVIENVPGLVSVDEGEQLTLGIELLENSGFDVTDTTILNAAEYGVPQNRQRVFVCGTRFKRRISFPDHESSRVPTYKALEEPVEDKHNHVTRRHKAESVMRYMDLDYGGRDQLGRVDRLHPGLPSKTIIAGGTKGGGRSHLHPFVPRTLSVRECARLQSFPDSFVFTGSAARQFTQVGNAVPPLLAYSVATAIHRSCYGK